MPHRQTVKAQDFDSCITGSNPVGAVFIKEVVVMGNLNTCCGTCCWHEYCVGEWICDNEYSDSYGVETDYNDTCPDWEEK